MRNTYADCFDKGEEAMVTLFAHIIHRIILVCLWILIFLQCFACNICYFEDILLPFEVLIVLCARLPLLKNIFKLL